MSDWPPKFDFDRAHRQIISESFDAPLTTDEAVRLVIALVSYEIELSVELHAMAASAKDLRVPHSLPALRLSTACEIVAQLYDLDENMLCHFSQQRWCRLRKPEMMTDVLTVISAHRFVGRVAELFGWSDEEITEERLSQSIERQHNRYRQRDERRRN